MTPGEIDDFIGGHDWQFAKTMAHMPIPKLVVGESTLPRQPIRLTNAEV
jgi:hypothetical protein